MKKDQIQKVENFEYEIDNQETKDLILKKLVRYQINHKKKGP